MLTLFSTLKKIKCITSELKKSDFQFHPHTHACKAMPCSSRSDTSGEIYRRKTSWAVGVSWVRGAFYVPRNWDREQPAAVAEPRDGMRSAVTQAETRSAGVKQSTLGLRGQRKQCGFILSTVVSHERFEAGNDMI